MNSVVLRDWGDPIATWIYNRVWLKRTTHCLFVHCLHFRMLFHTLKLTDKGQPLIFYLHRSFYWEEFKPLSQRGQLRKGHQRELQQDLLALIWSHTCSWFISVCTWGALSDQLGSGKQAGNNTVYVGSFKWESRKLWTEIRIEDFTVTYNEDPTEVGNWPWQSGHSCQALRRHQRVWGL